MSRLFPFRSPIPRDREDALLVSLTDSDADNIFDALSSRMTREILDSLYRDPAPASEVAEATDTSLQNARYHLNKLQEAGLITVADTWYSDRGVEMQVYAPTKEAIVLIAGETHDHEARALLKRLVGVVAILGGGILFIAYVLDRLASGPHAGGAGPPTTASSGTESGAGTMTTTATAVNNSTTTNATVVNNSTSVTSSGVHHATTTAINHTATTAAIHPPTFVLLAGIIGCCVLAAGRVNERR